MFPLKFRGEVNRQETRVMGLSSSEDRIIVAGVVLAWYQRVTDGQTESIIANTALCVALATTRGVQKVLQLNMMHKWHKENFYVIIQYNHP